MDKTPIQRAIEAVGGQTNLATALSIHPSLVSQWVTGRRPVAANHVLGIEKATGGRVTRYALRPDVFGQPPANDDGDGADPDPSVVTDSAA